MIPETLVQELNFYITNFDEITSRYGLEKIKTMGDSYLCVAGLPLKDDKHAEHVVASALELQQFIKQEKEERVKEGRPFFEIRTGIHSGSVVAGIVGVKKFAYDIWGDAVNTAARMEQNSAAGKINISQSTYDLVKDKFTCEYRGEIEAKNKGKLKMYFVS
jgi:class 3 adenylate cyclase